MSKPVKPSQDKEVLIILDGRQSQRAAAIQRGVCRMLAARGYTSLCEFSLKNNRRADVIAIGASGDIWIIEIKSSIEDFRSDQKWPDYKDYCDNFFFAVDTDFPAEVIPKDTGLMIADKYGGDIIRHASEHKIAANRRKAVTLQFARSAAQRLQDLNDPGGSKTS